MANRIKKLLIANRGEIAVRIIRAAQDLGIRAVQACSDADEDSLAARLADETVNIGPPQAAKSYLDAEGILKAAIDSGADAIHPGYGFLAENAAFADAVSSAGLIFVGPGGDAIALMGDKAKARAQAIKAGVPVAPGTDGLIADMDDAERLAGEIGYPVMVKASAGGGGRGIRVARSADELRRLVPQASSEAKAAFGEGGVYLEKRIERARHVEVQVMGDGKDAVHFFERECSLQRRRQKVWEEAPSPTLSEEVREKLCASAVSLAKSVGYKGAGTVEYLYDDRTEDFHFIEMNARIQVEHPVTEMICGIDLVGKMIEIADGSPLGLRQEGIARSGHAIEARLNAEDPSKDFMPFPGTVEGLTIPGGPGVRFDHFLYQGYCVPPFYDSLLGKLIVWAESREKALSRLGRALNELEIGGVATTAPLFKALLSSPEVQANQFHAAWLEPWLDENREKLGGKGGE